MAQGIQLVDESGKPLQSGQPPDGLNLVDESGKPLVSSRPSHGVTGSWQPPQRDYSNIPVLSQLAQFGRGAIDTLKGAYQLTQLTPEEKAAHPDYPLPFAPPGVIAKHMFLDPQVAEYRKSVDRDLKAGRPRRPGNLFAAENFERAGHLLAAATPVIGPLAAGLTERGVGGQPSPGDPGAVHPTKPDPFGAAGSLATMWLTGALLKQVGSPRVKTTKPLKPIQESQKSALVRLSSSGIKNADAYQVVDTAFPLIQTSSAETGISMADFHARGFHYKTGEVGVREAGRKFMDLVDHAVDVSDRPFRDVLNKHGEVQANRAQFGSVKSPQIQTDIMNDLRSLAADDEVANPALSKALQGMASRVQLEGSTFNGLNRLKVLSNKKSSPLFDKSTGAQINASADAAYAWRLLGDTIRGRMYPELQRISGVNLREAGLREAAVMDVRDGVKQNYQNKTLPAHAEWDRGYWNRLMSGSPYRLQMLKRAIVLEPSPAGKFNTDVRMALGPNTPPMPKSVPVYLGRNPNNPPTIAGEQLGLIPFGEGVDTHPLLAPPAGTANVRKMPSGSTMGEDIFRIQQRANQAARRAPPQTIRGEQPRFDIGYGPEGKHAMTPEAPKAETFHAGKTGIRRETVDQFEPSSMEAGKPGVTAKGQIARDYRRQSQLFSIAQTPYKWEVSKRSTYMLSDLQDMMHEIDNYIKANPNSPQRVGLMQDYVQIRQEVIRRQAARKAGKQ